MEVRAFRFAGWLFTYVGALFLIPACLKRQRFALFLFATVMIVPLVLLNPFLITFLQGKVNDIGIIRLVLLPPYGLMLGWLFWDQISAWVKRWLSLAPCTNGFVAPPGYRRLAWSFWGAGIALMGYISGFIKDWITLTDLYDPASNHVYSLAATHHKSRQIDQPPYEFLIAELKPGYGRSQRPGEFLLSGWFDRTFCHIRRKWTFPTRRRSLS